MAHVAAPATPAQIAMYGHIAAMLRAYLKRTDQDIAAVNKAIGKERGYTGPYVWLNCKGGPGPANRVKLAKLLGCQPDDLAAKVRGKAPPPQRSVSVTPLPGVVSVHPKPADVLSFQIASDGTARIKLDVSLPLEPGKALFRMILDAGVAFTAET